MAPRIRQASFRIPPCLSLKLIPSIAFRLKVFPSMLWKPLLTLLSCLFCCPWIFHSENVLDHKLYIIANDRY